MKIRVLGPSGAFLDEIEGDVAWLEVNGRGEGEIGLAPARRIRALLTQHNSAEGPFQLECADGTRFRGCNFVNTASGKFLYITMPDAPSPVVPVPVG
jgi:hypothetical protein